MALRDDIDLSWLNASSMFSGNVAEKNWVTIHGHPVLIGGSGGSSRSGGGGGTTQFKKGVSASGHVTRVGQKVGIVGQASGPGSVGTVQKIENPKGAPHRVVHVRTSQGVSQHPEHEVTHEYAISGIN